MAPRTLKASSKVAQPVAPKATVKSIQPDPAVAKVHKRSRAGCYTCRLRRKKCDESRPTCRGCSHLEIPCEYERPTWWSDPQSRGAQKQLIKDIIVTTKTDKKTAAAKGEKGDNQEQLDRVTRMAMGIRSSIPSRNGHRRTGSLSKAQPAAGRSRERSQSVDSDDSIDFGNGQDLDAENGFKGPGPYYPAIWGPDSMPPMGFSGMPYEVTSKTDEHTWINDVHTHTETTTSTTCYPPNHPGHNFFIPDHGQPQFYADEFFKTEPNGEVNGMPETANLSFSNMFPDITVQPHASQTTISLDENDQPLLDHFIEHVIPIIFPVLKLNQTAAARADLILPTLERNPTYLESCLTMAAIHLRSSPKAQTFSPQQCEALDSEIVLHRFRTVSMLVDSLSLSQAGGPEAGQIIMQALEATLSMILFQTTVGKPDDALPDIAWHNHFGSASEMVTKINLPSLVNPHPDNSLTLFTNQYNFNMALTTWIDILGGALLGRAPLFADTYRNFHLSAANLGLTTLMGVDDKLMFLISEVACLEAVKLGELIDQTTLCNCITLLAKHLDMLEPANQGVECSPSNPQGLEYPVTSQGHIIPHQLSKNVTALFLKATRIYLLSLIPGQGPTMKEMSDMVSQFTSLLAYIPSGPDGFDRCITWPLLVTGTYSARGSPFRTVFKERVKSMGEAGRTGSLAKTDMVLNELWIQNDAHQAAHDVIPDTDGQKGEPEFVHWRRVMTSHGWDFLLI